MRALWAALALAVAAAGWHLQDAIGTAGVDVPVSAGGVVLAVGSGANGALATMLVSGATPRDGYVNSGDGWGICTGDRQIAPGETVAPVALIASGSWSVTGLAALFVPRAA